MIVYLICYAASFLFARAGHYYMSGIVLILAAIYLYCYDYRRTHNLIHLRALFSLSWVGGQGVSCLKLSTLQTDWAVMTWICFLAALLGFWLVFACLDRRFHDSSTPAGRRDRLRGFEGNQGLIFRGAAAVTLVSSAAFSIEAVVLGFIPFFVRKVPHAYSVFHISGVHYFTVSCVLVPGLAVLYFCMSHRRTKWQDWGMIAFTLVSLLIPILCVSRFQLILAVAMAAFAYIAMQNRFRAVYGLALAAGMVPFYILLTIARSHNVAYLMDIFAMKNSGMPIFMAQPYIYIANNYDNFNCLVTQLPPGGHTLGLRTLFPLWAFTGLKFIKPELVSFELYRTKTELTTLTLFYDAYYDFGLIGVLLFSCLLGAAAWLLVRMLGRTRNPVGYLYYAQLAVYLMFSFFTTWFSSYPAAWFYLGVTTLIYLYYYRKTS